MTYEDLIENWIAPNFEDYDWDDISDKAIKERVLEILNPPSHRRKQVDAFIKSVNYDLLNEYSNDALKDTRIDNFNDTVDSLVGSSDELLSIKEDLVSKEAPSVSIQRIDKKIEEVEKKEKEEEEKRIEELITEDRIGQSRQLEGELVDEIESIFNTAYDEGNYAAAIQYFNEEISNTLSEQNELRQLNESAYLRIRSDIVRFKGEISGLQ